MPSLQRDGLYMDSILGDSFKIWISLFVFNDNKSDPAVPDFTHEGIKAFTVSETRKDQLPRCLPTQPKV